MSANVLENIQRLEPSESQSSALTGAEASAPVGRLGPRRGWTPLATDPPAGLSGLHRRWYVARDGTVVARLWSDLSDAATAARAVSDAALCGVTLAAERRRLVVMPSRFSAEWFGPVPTGRVLHLRADIDRVHSSKCIAQAELLQERIVVARFEAVLIPVQP